MTKLSFIIPTYNAKHTIIRTLDGIYALPMSEIDFEVIVVDDCSTDDTVQIIEQYMKSHTNLIFLRQKENHRQGAARNRGLEIAKGEYVTFVDADDIILPGIAHALKTAQENKADLVYCSCYHEKTPTETVLKEIDMQEDEIMSGIEFCEKYQHEGVFWYPWGILYRREWLVNLNYPFIEDRQHEDRDWLAFIMSSAPSVINSKKPIYRYVCNPDSTCRSPRYSTVFDHIASGIRHIDLSEKLKANCPNLSATLYAFGVDEIYKSIRLRNLTKYGFKDNKHLYDSKHLAPLMADLKRLCKEIKLPIDGAITIYYPIFTTILVFFASPIAQFIRNIKH